MRRTNTALPADNAPVGVPGQILDLVAAALTTAEVFSTIQSTWDWELLSLFCTFTRGGATAITAVVYRLQCSPDGTNWYDVLTVNNSTGVVAVSHTLTGAVGTTNNLLLQSPNFTPSLTYRVGALAVTNAGVAGDSAAVFAWAKRGIN